jgi:hypothetical protein
VKGLHICYFRGTRIVDPPPGPPFTAMRRVRGHDGKLRVVAVTIDPATEKKPRIRCDGEAKSGRGQCRAWSVGGAMFPWGAKNLCARCLDDECGPTEEAPSTTDGGTP